MTSSRAQHPHRIALTALVLAGTVLVTAFVALISGMPDADWNSARLAPAVGWVSGVPLYAGPDHGTMQSTLYGPVKEMLMTPAALGRNPTTAIWIGGTINLLLLVVPLVVLLWVHGLNETRTNRLQVAAASLFAAAGLLVAHSTRYATDFIHVDAPAIGLGLLSCSLLIPRDESSNRKTTGTYRLGWAALLAVLAAWTKQVEAPLAFAQLGFLFWLYGARRAFDYFLRLAGWGLAVLLLFSASFGFKNLWFNLIVIPRGHPKHFDLSSVGFIFIEVLVASSFGVFLMLLALRSTPSRSLISRPWLLLALAALALVPTSLIGRLIAGGGTNSYHFVYFLLGASALILATGEIPRVAGVSRRGLALGFALGSVAWAASTIQWSDLRDPFDNPQQRAYEFALAHPGECYFPWSPLPTLLADDRLYHFDFSIHDRIAAGRPPSDEHFRRHIPDELRYVMFRERPWDMSVLRFLPEFDRQITIAGMPGWIVFTRSNPTDLVARDPADRAPHPK